jgi:Asp-tRNA(Asn)/Glu-tRNA(Gln) amidotransferase A subunit family amidase
MLRRCLGRLGGPGRIGGFVAVAVCASTASAQRAAIEVHEATIPALQAAMTAGRVTSVQLVDAYLERIAAYDAQGPALTSILRLNPRARADAARLDTERRAGRVRGPLHGIPILLKDNFDTADLPTTGGLLALASLQPRTDAFVVQRLRDAGAVILGKTNLHELAHGITTVSSLGGQTRNPYDPSRNPGGSSGGTGAAIAASFAAVGWGSDTCGSIRIPCAFNSLVGLRPTLGLVSRSGIMPLSHTQDTGGPMARTVTDLAIALDATVAPDTTDPAARAARGRTIHGFVDSLVPTALRGARIGVLTHYFADTDDEIADTVRAAIRTMRGLGAEVVDVRIPGFDSLMAGTSLIPFEMKFDFNDYLARSPNPPVASLTEVLQRGLYHAVLEPRYRLRDTMKSRDSEPYKRALARQGVLRERLVAFFDSLRLDALVYPAMRQPPAAIGEVQQGGTCQLAAHTGLPALSMPAGFTAAGLPVGIELLGRPFGDARLVAMAFAFEQAGARRRAPLTTPALSAGPPRPLVFTATVLSASATARGQFSFAPGANQLRFEVRVTGVPAENVFAVVLIRADSSTTRVIHRFSGPGGTRADGTLTMAPADRLALTQGRLFLGLSTSAGTSRVRIETASATSQ